jgi:glycosyltransferase involved in cell wall biosynthesis
MRNEKMKILQIIYESPGSPFGFGGAGIRAYEIYKRLKDRHDITLLCMRYPGAADGEIEGLKHIFLGTESKNLTLSVMAYTLKTMKFVRKNGGSFDVIVENFLPPTPFFSRYLTKTPVILQIQDFWGRHTFKRYPLRFAFPMFLVEKFYPKLYKRIMFVSEITKEKFNLSAKIVIVPNGIDETFLQASEKNDNSILFISSIDRYKKGLDILLKAFSQISPLFRNVSLSIAGTGRDFDVIRNEVDNLPVSIRENIELPGWISGEEKTKAISRALFTVLPSRHESSPISILESAACGKPAIVSDIPELAFVCREGFGISFSSGSADDLSEKIRLLLTDNEQREALGKRGREYASQFLWDNIAIRFENVLRESVRNRDDQ